MTWSGQVVDFKASLANTRNLCRCFNLRIGLCTDEKVNKNSAWLLETFESLITAQFSGFVKFLKLNEN